MAFRINGEIVNLLSAAFPTIVNTKTVKEMQHRKSQGADFSSQDTILLPTVSEIASRELSDIFDKYDTNNAIVKSEGNEYGSIRTYQLEKEYAISSLGTPLFFPMTIDGVLLPNAPLITVTSVKHVVKTPVAGRDYTVKEIVSLDDYKINIKGVATNYDAINGVAKNDSGVIYEDYPEDWLVLLNNLYKRKRSERANDTISLPVQCDLLRMLGIHYLVLEKISFPAMVGVQSALAYEMEAVSDEHIELLLADNSNQ